MQNQLETATVAAMPSRPWEFHPEPLTDPAVAHGVGTTAVDGRSTLKPDSLTPSRRRITSRRQCPLLGVLRSRSRTYGGRVFWDAMTSAISALQTGSRIWNARLLMRKLCTVLPQLCDLLTRVLEKCPTFSAPSTKS
jgi:hypothetical protein